MAGRCRRSRRHRSSVRAPPRQSSSRWACSRPCFLLRRDTMFADILREDLGTFRQHILFHPREERVAFARDRVPFLVETVVAWIVALRIGGKGAAWDLNHV